MDTRPRTFSALWVEGALGPYEQLCLRSFVAKGCTLELYTYDPDVIAPPGVTLRDANDIVPTERRRTFPGSGFAHFSNFFRYSMLGRAATTWVDTDLLLLDPHALPDQDHLFGRQSDGIVNTALLALPMDSPAVPALIAASDLPPDARLRWGLLGPKLLTSTLQSFELDDRALPVATLYPIGWEDIWRLYDPRQRDWCEDTTRGAATLHLWNQFLKKDGLKSFAPAPQSFLGLRAAELDIDFGLPEAPPALLRHARDKWAKPRRGPLQRVTDRLRALR